MFKKRNISKKKKDKLPLDEFATGLTTWFKKLKKDDIETLEKCSESVKDMSQDELMKLDWELIILDMFIITYCCRLMINDEKMSDKIIDIFHEYVYEEMLKDMESIAGSAFQEEIKIKYEAYFEAMKTKDSLWNLCKELGKNIYGESFQSAMEMGALRIVCERNLRFTFDLIKGIKKKFNLVEDKG